MSLHPPPPPDTTSLSRILPALATSIMPQQTGCPVLESITAFSERPAPHGLLPAQDRAGQQTETGRPLEEGGSRRLHGGALPKLSRNGIMASTPLLPLPLGAQGSHLLCSPRCPQPPPAPSPFSLPGPSSINLFQPNLNPILSGAASPGDPN